MAKFDAAAAARMRKNFSTHKSASAKASAANKAARAAGSRRTNVTATDFLARRDSKGGTHASGGRQARDSKGRFR